MGQYLCPVSVVTTWNGQRLTSAMVRFILETER